MPPAPAKEVKYPQVLSTVHVGSNALTIERAKAMLGWEDEESYKQRILSGEKSVGIKPPSNYGDEFLLRDPAGQKIRCRFNMKNRPFSLGWAEAIAQDILHSGPGLPLEERRWQFNGEAVIFGKYGNCLSGQHRLIAFILAVLTYRKNPALWKEKGGWKTEPVLETIVTVGIDESQRTTRTMDNVKPRSLADVFYTSNIFTKYTQRKKEECSKLLQGAINFLWKRTGVGTDETLKHQTHGESVAFFDRHPKLLECIDQIYKLNSGDDGKKITGLNLSPGVASGTLYLMGSSSTEPDEYRSGVNARTEKALDWERWEKSTEFWLGLANASPQFDPVANALADLVDMELGAGGRNIEKTGVLAKAWERYVEDAEFDREELRLDYVKDGVTGENKLKVGKEFPNFGGIDVGEGIKNSRAELSPEDLAKRAKEQKEKTLNGTRDKPEPPKPVKVESSADANAKENEKQLRQLKDQYPGKVLAFVADVGTWTFWMNDATFAAGVLGLKADKYGHLDRLRIEAKDIPEKRKKLLAAKVRLATFKNVDGEPVVTDIKV